SHQGEKQNVLRVDQKGGRNAHGSADARKGELAAGQMKGEKEAGDGDTDQGGIQQGRAAALAKVSHRQRVVLRLLVFLAGRREIEHGLGHADFHALRNGSGLRARGGPQGRAAAVHFCFGRLERVGGKQIAGVFRRSQGFGGRLLNGRRQHGRLFCAQRGRPSGRG